MYRAKATVINGKVYCAGNTPIFVDNYVIYCYDPTADKWMTLEPLPVRHFGLGQLCGRVVAVGGKNQDTGRAANEIYTYSERNKMWTKEIPAMPTARDSPGVLSLQSTLLVAGGCDSKGAYTDVVEIFKQSTLQWYVTDGTPTVHSNISLCVIGDTCYAVGGYKKSTYSDLALQASVSDLLRKAVPADQSSPQDDDSDKKSAWTALPYYTPTYQPSAAVLAGNLLVVGGKETSEGGEDKKEIHSYSVSTNSWIYIGDLPAPRYGAAVAVLSSPEIEFLVIGGLCGQAMDTVYNGTLHFKF